MLHDLLRNLASDSISQHEAALETLSDYSGIPTSVLANKLNILKQLSIRLLQQGVDVYTPPRLMDLVRQALAITERQEDFEIIFHPEEGHEHLYMPEGYSDAAGHDYLGREWVVDHDAWVELRSIGNQTK